MNIYTTKLYVTSNETSEIVAVLYGRGQKDLVPVAEQSYDSNDYSYDCCHRDAHVVPSSVREIYVND